jgi:hypothetical protein
MQKSTMVCLIDVNIIVVTYINTFVIDDFSQRIYFITQQQTEPGLSLISINAHENTVHKYVNFEGIEPPRDIQMTGDNNGTLYTSFVNVNIKKAYL